MDGDVLPIPDRLQGIRATIATAAAAVDRSPEVVVIMAAVKTRNESEIAKAVEAGITVLGENRVQEGLAHIQALPPDLRARCRVHFIGRLQANKARKALLAFDSLDSVDSVPLALRLSRIAVEEGLQRDVMIEVNLGEESQKGGVAPEETAALAEIIHGLKGLRLTGLMGVPPFGGEPEASRPFFRLLSRLFENLRRNYPEALGFRHLSMGMSHDFPVAVEEGATLLRLGTALFGPRRPQ